MNAIRTLREFGQSLWLDNINREMLDSGRLQGYIDEYGITGLTSNPTLFEHALRASDSYDPEIAERARAGLDREDLLLELMLEDLSRAAEIFGPIHRATERRDGWVSMEISPLLAHDTRGTIEAATALHRWAGLPNLMIKVPGTSAGIPAVEELIFSGVPVNVTLLFSPEHYVAAAEAYQRGIERRREAGLVPRVASVASLFVSRWDVAVHDRVPPELRNRLGLAIAALTYRRYRESEKGAEPTGAVRQPGVGQRLLWASTSCKDPEAIETLYAEGLAASDTVNTLPEKTLLALADYGEVKRRLVEDGGVDALLSRFASCGIDVTRLAGELQEQGVEAFQKSWSALLEEVEARSDQLLTQRSA